MRRRAALGLVLGVWLLVAPWPVTSEPSANLPAGSALIIPATVRVGLATDLVSLVVPCCEEGVMAVVDGRKVAVTAPLVIEPDVGEAQRGFHRIQVAAFKDETQAEGLARQLSERFGEPADAVFDAGTDLYRIRLGHFREREAAESTRVALLGLGYSEAWVVSEAGTLVNPALRVRHGKSKYRISGRSLGLKSVGGNGIRVLNRRYRGRLMVFLNDRGSLNLINEVSVDDYLRGVVPREMGPGVFSQLETLKAQAVAARTYALRNMGEFEREGYDICATPRCQVYGGMDAEHPLSDQAVRETTGEVLTFDGQLVDALYSSTCGGHTENVEVVFPSKNYSYLKGVPCVESGVDRLAGNVADGRPFPDGLTERLFGPSAEGAEGSDVQRLDRRLGELAQQAGVRIPMDHLRSLDRGEVQRYLASLFDLTLDARLFVAPEDLPYLLDHPRSHWREESTRVAAYLLKSGLLPGKIGQPLSQAEIEEMLLQLALYLRVLDEREVRYRGLRESRLQVEEGGELRSYALPDRLATFRLAGNDYAAAPLSLLPGDVLRLYLQDDLLVGVRHDVDPDGAGFDRSSRMSSWTRFHRDSTLAASVRTRYPDIDLQSLEVLERGVSSRVKKIRIDGKAGNMVEVEGLAIRWTLDLPDTLFTAKRLRPRGREAGWLFTGRGWGHGVGMCQTGAYGMGLRGHGYGDILRHYYSGVKLARLPTASGGNLTHR